MFRRVATRSQRRTEKKQAVVLLALVLVVALVSFMLGVLAGRSSSKPAVVATASPPPRLSVALPEAPAPAAAAPIGQQSAESLTFYDSLPQGGQAPLGSGINLPPDKAPAPVAAAPVEPNKPATATAGASGTTGTTGTAGTVVATPPAKSPVVSPPPPAKAVAPVVASPVAPGGYLVQAAAFPRREDARALQTKLGQKGYAAFTEEAQLGAKGVWYRVYVGPYATAGAADAAVARLKAEEKLTALVRKR